MGAHLPAYHPRMNSIHIELRLCWAARSLASTHGVAFAATLLCEQNVAIETALDFLTLSLQELSLRYSYTSEKDIDEIGLQF